MENLLGKKVKDKISGFTGIATSKHSYITGCDQYGVLQKLAKDGTLPTIRYFDDVRLKVIGKGVKVEEADRVTGCDNREHP